jgi:hypothetical protein
MKYTDWVLRIALCAQYSRVLPPEVCLILTSESVGSLKSLASYINTRRARWKLTSVSRTSSGPTFACSPCWRFSGSVVRCCGGILESCGDVKTCAFASGGARLLVVSVLGKHCGEGAGIHIKLPREVQSIVSGHEWHWKLQILQGCLQRLVGCLR